MISTDLYVGIGGGAVCMGVGIASVGADRQIIVCTRIYIYICMLISYVHVYMM